MQLRDASILVVDDEPMLREIFADWFTNVAGRVLVAENGAHALEVLAVNNIDLIITDVRMPVLDGMGLLKRLRASGRQMPSVIFVSGFTDLEAREAYALGARALLGKPIEYDELIHAAERSLAEPFELWKTARDLSAYPTLTRGFVSVAAALEQRQIAFGQGGFCLETSQVLAEGPLNVSLDFAADRFLLAAQGIVRWRSGSQAGIELTWVAPEALPRVLQLAHHADSFIPSGITRPDSQG